MLGILYTFWGMGFLVFVKKGSFFLPGVMWAKLSDSCGTRHYLPISAFLLGCPAKTSGLASVINLNAIAVVEP